MDRHREMEAFVTVVEEGSFSAAARSLHLSPSAVSKQMARLEERLKVPLFRRTSRKLSLTDAGRAYFERCQHILIEVRSLEDALDEYRSSPTGLVRISLSHGLARAQVVPVLERLFARHPELRVELHLTDRLVDLIEGDIDIALRLGTLQDSSLTARRLASQVRLICASPAYLERHGTPETPQDLLQHNCLTMTVQDSLNRWDFIGPDGPYTLPVNGNLQASDMLCLLEAGVAGLGIVRLSNLVNVDAMLEGNLVPILVEHTPMTTVPLHAVTASRKVSPKVRATVDFLVEVFKSVPDPMSLLSDQARS